MPEKPEIDFVVKPEVSDVLFVHIQAWALLKASFRLRW